MAYDAGKVKGGIHFDTSEFKRAAQFVKQSQSQMAGQAKITGSAFSGMWKQVAAGMGVTQLIGKSIRFLSDQVKDTIKKGREFEKEWANVTTMLTISKDKTLEMKKELMKLSPTLGDTTDLARGMYQVLSASIEPAKAIKFLGEAAKSAKAGVTSTFTAVDALTTAINAYGLEAENVTEISDIMFQTVKRGKLTYEGMAGALGTVVPIAAQIGVNFKEVAAAMATLTRQGIDVNTTTVQLRQVMVSVLKPSAQAQDMANKLGLEFNATALRTKGLAKFLMDVKEKAGDDAEALTALFGNVRALTGVMGLAGEAAQDFRDDLMLMESAAGSTEEAFRKKMDSLNFWIDTLKTSTDKFKISFYTGFADPIKAGIKTSEDLEKQVKDLQGMFEDLGNIVGQLGKTFFADIVQKWKDSTITIERLKFFAEGFTLAIKKGQIPTLKNAAKAWAEHHIELEKGVTGQKAMTEATGPLIDEWKNLIGWVKEYDSAQATANRENEDALKAYRELRELILGINMLKMPTFKIPELIESPEKLLEGMEMLDEPGEYFEYEWDKSMAGTEERSQEWLDEQLKLQGVFLEGTKSNLDKFKTESIISIDTVSNVWNNAIGQMIDSLTTWGQTTGSILDAVRGIFGGFIRDMIAGLGKLVLAEIFAAQKDIIIQKAKAIASAIASVFKSLPWFLAIPAAATAVGAVTMLFSKLIPSFAEGGIAMKPMEAKVGHGKGEAIIPLEDIPEVVERITHETSIGGPTFYMMPQFNISVLDPYEFRDYLSGPGGDEIINWMSVKAKDKINEVLARK